jgi:serine protease Do
VREGLSTDLREFFGRIFEEQGERVPGEPENTPIASLAGIGTGFLIGAGGEILTNNHVVEGADEIQVRLSEGQWLHADVVGVDPFTDLALLRVETEKPLPGVRFGDSNKVNVGEWVLAIGNPFGLEETVTAGILSAKGRTLEGSNFNGYLQTDAPIHSGNSGGPLFNLEGEVIGVNTAVVTEASGIGFAIPINLVRGLLPDLRRYGRVRRGWIGVSIQDVTPELRQYFKVGRKGGVVITRVQANGPAWMAGLRPGDILLSMGGITLNKSEDYGRVLKGTPIGVLSEMEIIRTGKRMKTEVIVRELKGSRSVRAKRPRTVQLRYPPYGLGLRQLSPGLAERMGLSDPAGLIVDVVEPGSPADRAGMRRGDVVRGVDLQSVRTLDGFQVILRGIQGREALFLIQRGDQRFFTLLKVLTNTVHRHKTDS